MNKIKYFIFVLLTFFLFNNNVHADMDVCKYTILGSTNRQYYVNISYTDGNQFKIEWNGPGLLGDGVHSNTGNDGTSLLKDGQFYPSIDSFLSKGKCPEHAYVDEGGGLASEFCLDSDGSTCASHDDMGTNFSKNKTNKLMYSATDSISTEGVLAAEQVKKLCGTSIESITNSFYSKYQINGTIPSFIADSSEYKNAIQSINDATQDCINQANEKEQNGEITHEQAEKIRDNAKKNNDLLNDLDSKADSSNKGGADAQGQNTTGCGLISGDFLNFLQWAFDVIKVVGPVMALLLGMVDFIKATASGEDDAKKKAIKNVKNRLIAAFLLFFIPAILQLALNLANGLIPGLDNNNVTCGIK